MFKQNRRQMLSVVERVVENLSQNKKKNIEGQLGFFETMNKSEEEEVEFPNLEEFPRPKLLAMEKEIVKMYISGHPLLDYSKQIESPTVNKIADIYAKHSGSSGNKAERVKVKAVISSVKLKITKNNTTMAFLKVEDLTGAIEVIVFPKILSEYSSYIREENLVTIRGTIKFEDEGDLKIICDSISSIEEDSDSENEKNSPENLNPKKEKADNIKRDGLYLKIKNDSCEIYNRAKVLLSIFEGTTPVYIFFEDEKTLKLAPRKMWVQLNDVLVKELKNQIGEKNVAVKI